MLKYAVKLNNYEPLKSIQRHKHISKLETKKSSSQVQSDSSLPFISYRETMRDLNDEINDLKQQKVKIKNFKKQKGKSRGG